MQMTTTDGTVKSSSPMFPMIRRVFPTHQVAQSIVSVQPMSLPSGSVFYLDHLPIQSPIVDDSLLADTLAGSMLSVQEMPNGSALVRIVLGETETDDCKQQPSGYRCLQPNGAHNVTFPDHVLLWDSSAVHGR